MLLERKADTPPMIGCWSCVGSRLYEPLREVLGDEPRRPSRDRICRKSSRQVGPYLFTLIAPGEEDGHWPWVVNRTDGTDPHSSFGKPVAQGRARSREEAMRELEAAYEEQVKKVATP